MQLPSLCLFYSYGGLCGTQNDSHWTSWECQPMIFARLCRDIGPQLYQCQLWWRCDDAVAVLVTGRKDRQTGSTDLNLQLQYHSMTDDAPTKALTKSSFSLPSRYLLWSNQPDKRWPVFSEVWFLLFAEKRLELSTTWTLCKLDCSSFIFATSCTLWAYDASKKPIETKQSIQLHPLRSRN